MKKIFLAIAVAVIGLAACNKTDEVKTFSANIILKAADTTVPMPEEFSAKVTSQEGVTVFEQTVANTGSALTVSGLISGIYNISVSGVVLYGGCSYGFNGALNSCPITEDGQNVEITLNVSKEAALLFKEIYYTGPSGLSEPGTTQPYRDDNFFEIYNNSAADMYLDGLCIANVAPTAATEILSWELDGGRNAADYVFCQSIWQFPGNGTEYKIEAGKSVVVVSVPADHTKKVEGSLDLSAADFEFFVVDQNIYPDVPTIPNMILKFGSFGNGADRYLPGVSGPAMILFKPEGEINNSTFVSPVGEDDKCKEIPIAWIIDGVEGVEQAKNIEFKRLPAAVDGGAVYMTEGIVYYPLPSMPTFSMTRYHHTSVSFSRKYKNGTDITGGLVDTNNSTEDFVANDAPVIRRGL